MKERYSYEYVKNYIENESQTGYRLLSKEYKNANTKLQIQCNEGHIFPMSFDNFHRLGCRCPICQGLRLTYEMVKQYIEVESGSGYKLLSTNYINNKSPLIMKCDKGHEYQSSYVCFKDNGCRCTVCEKENKKKRQTHSYEYIKIFIETNSELKLLSDSYANNETYLLMQCKEGHEFNRTFGNFLGSRNCPICRQENNRGENHHSWNPNLTPEDREPRRLIDGYDDWVFSVYERDNYMCQCCSKKSDSDINAHHMDGYNWCKERRLDVTNGITLCGNCHTKFHIDYGYGDNTENQFLYWIIENGIGIFNIDEIKKESVLLNKPEKRESIDKKVYFRKYYEEHDRKYCEEDLDNIFNEVILENKEPKYLTTNGFEDISGINSITYTKVFNTDWLGVLDRYNKRDELYQYVLDEYMKFYLKDYKCSFEQFQNTHEYITQQLIKLIGREKIKEDCGFKGLYQQHNLLGLKENLNDIIIKLGRIPFYNEFIKETKISISSYLLYFNMDNQDYDKLLESLIDDKQLINEYFKNKQQRIVQNASIGGKSCGNINGYTDEEKEIEFRRVFDEYYNKYGKYPGRREFNELSIYTDGAYRKKYKLNWSQTKQKYGYPI